MHHIMCWVCGSWAVFYGDVARGVLGPFWAGVWGGNVGSECIPIVILARPTRLSVPFSQLLKVQEAWDIISKSQ